MVAALHRKAQNLGLVPLRGVAWRLEMTVFLHVLEQGLAIREALGAVDALDQVHLATDEVDELDLEKLVKPISHI
jgi:hypothetical protein